MRLIYIAIGWALGMAVAAGLSEYADSVWPLLAGGAALALLVAWRYAILRPWLLVALVFTLGGWRYSAVPQTAEITEFNARGGLMLEGIVIAEPDVRETRIDLRIEVWQVLHASRLRRVRGLALVQAPSGTPVRYGDRVKAIGVLVSPFVSDSFSYRDFLARSGVFSLMPNAASVEVVSSGHGSPLYAALLDIKQAARGHINRSLPEPAASLLTGIVLGDDRGMPVELTDAFSAVGASHIIAISGFNMVILASVVTRLFNRGKLRGWPTVIISIGLIGVYTVFVGAGAAVVRAALMSAVLVIGGALRRRTFVPTSLALVVILLSAINPGALWDVGFQLSAFATLGLATFTAPLGRWFDSMLQRLLPRSAAEQASAFLGEPLIASLAAQIATLPLIVLYFERISLVSLLVGLLVIPVQAVLLLVGLAALMVAFILPGLAQFLFWFDMLFLNWTIGVVRAFARLPFAEVTASVDGRLVALFYAVMIGGVIMAATRPLWPERAAGWVRGRAVVTGLLSLSVGFLALLLLLVFSRPDGKLHVWALDMEHQNALLIQTPGGAHVLIDGGRLPNRLLAALGDRLPFNKRSIDAVILTHPDPNDFRALLSVVERYDVGVFISSGQVSAEPEYAELLTRLGQTPQVVATQGYRMVFDDGVQIEALAPLQSPGLDDNLGDGSLLLRLRYGDASFLLTSDASGAALASVMGAGIWPGAAVLQVPAHGDADSLSMSFLAAVGPQAVFIQTSPANRQGHPEQAVLGLLQGLPLYRTDQHGTIHFWTDGVTLWTQTAR